MDNERDEPAGFKVHNESRAQTGEQGRFTIDRVAPGEASIRWQPEDTATLATPVRYYQPAFVNVVPGQTFHLHLVIDGGRPLIGRVVAPAESGRSLDLAASNAYLVPKVHEVPYPAGLGQQDRREWLRKWRLTPAARTYRHQVLGLAHPLRLQPEGSFRVDEVQPGEYEIHVRVSGFAELTRDVTVPGPGAGPVGSPIDLGDLTLKR